MEYLRGDRDRPLILGADNEGMLMCYVDALFAVHPNMHRHTSGGTTMGRGFLILVSTKQELNTKNSVETELVGIGCGARQCGTKSNTFNLISRSCCEPHFLHTKTPTDKS
jgi:hypothetical protein